MKKMTFLAVAALLATGNRGAAQCSAPASVPNTNLIIELPFTNGTGTDISGHSLNATLTNNTSAAGYLSVPDKAVSFNGTLGSGGSIPHNAMMDATNQITISCWFKSNIINSPQRLVDKLAGITAGNFMMDMYLSKPRFFVGSVTLTGPTAFASNTWYHLVGTYDGITAKLYVNGTMVASAPLTGNLTSNTSPFNIGKDQSNGNRLSGSIDDIKYYTGALTATEVSMLYQVPVFVTQPQDASLCNNIVTLSSYASVAPYVATYKWKKDGVYLSDNAVYSGTNMPNLTISYGTAADTGMYYVEGYSPTCVMTVSDSAHVTLATAAPVNETGLILHYPFNGVNGSDVSTNSLHTTINASTASAAQDQNGYANMGLHFSGATGPGAVTPNNALLNPTGNFTIDLWFRTPLINSGARLVDKINGTTTGNYLIDIFGAKLRFFCGAVSVQPVTVLASNTWYHVTAVYDGVNASLYLNGTLQLSTPYSGALTPNTSPLIIGADQTSGSRLQGDINDLRFYSRALSAAEINMLPTVPEFVTQPQGGTYCPGDLVKLFVKPSISGATCQWKKNGINVIDGGNISGAINDTLTISNIGLSDYGDYACDVTGSNCLLATSDTAAIVQSGVVNVSNDNLVLYFPFKNGTGDDLSGNNLDMDFMQGVVPANDRNGFVSHALFFNGITSQCNVFSEPLMYSNGNMLTLTGWINPVSVGDQRIVDKNSSFILDIYLGELRFIVGAITVVTSGFYPPINTWTHIAGTYDGTTVKIYANGILVKSYNAPGVTIPVNVYQFLLGCDASGGYRFAGAMDEMRFYKRALSEAEIKALANAPSITAQPLNSVVCQYDGTQVSFNTVSPDSLSYQWIYNGAALSGETNDTLSIGAGATGAYYCTITNACISFATDTAFISTTAINTTVSLAAGVLTAQQAGAVYQWLDCNAGNAVISGATAQSYAPAADGDYAVVVAMSGCMDTSSCTPVTLTGVGITEKTTNGFSIYPNPATETLTIVSDASRGYVVIEIYGVDGKLLRTEKLSAQQNQVNVNELGKGFYSLRIISGSSIYNTRFVKQ